MKKYYLVSYNTEYLSNAILTESFDKEQLQVEFINTIKGDLTDIVGLSREKAEVLVIKTLASHDDIDSCLSIGCDSDGPSSATIRYGCDYETYINIIMSFLQDAGEQLLMDDLQRLEFTYKFIMPIDTVVHQYIENPRQISKPVELVVKNKAATLPSDAKTYTVSVIVGGEMKPYGLHGENVPRACTRYVEVDAETVDGHITRTHYPYPFTNDGSIEALHKLPQNGKRTLLPYERLFFYTLYKTPLTFEQFKQMNNGVTL